MTNNTIKNRIRKGLLESRGEIIVSAIAFKGVKRFEDGRIIIDQMTLTLDSIDGVLIDELKSCIDEIGMENNIEFIGILLDI